MAKQTIKEVINDKAQNLLNAVALWGAFYRANPHRFAKDFLNLNLRLFQKINLYEMMHNVNTIYLASRGQGKTFLMAVYCVIRCILYPGTKIAIASRIKGQAGEVIDKIDKILLKECGWGSANLRNEISSISNTQNKMECEFKNGSVIFVVTASDNARGHRANVLIIDEYRMVDPDIIGTVLRKFLTASREPGYLRKPEYKGMVERNAQIWASSAWYKSHWSYKKAFSNFKMMLSGKHKYFICALPYQLSIKEDLLKREDLIDEMLEDTFDEISFSIELGCLFYGQGNNSFFKYDDLAKCRKLKTPFYPLDIYKKRGINIPPLEPNERRILSVDVALMASTHKKNNDAAAILINRAIPTDSMMSYKSNYVYLETQEGALTEDLGQKVMRYFYEYDCTDLALDCTGIGIPIADYIAKDRLDPITGKTYTALTSCNNEDFRARCKVKGAKQVVWCMIGSPKYNSEIANQLRVAIQNGNISLLLSDIDAKEEIKKISGYANMTEHEKAQLLLPYIQTNFLINEAISLDYEINNDLIKLKEKSGMRKDRVSSMIYNNAVVQELSNKLKPKTKDEIKSLVDRLPFKTRKSTSDFD